MGFIRKHAALHLLTEPLAVPRSDRELGLVLGKDGNLARVVDRLTAERHPGAVVVRGNEAAEDVRVPDVVRDLDVVGVGHVHAET